MSRSRPGCRAPYFGTVGSGAFSPAGVRKRTIPLGPAAPRWARRLYSRSVRVLVALTDARTGAMIAGERDGWDYVWPRDAAAGAIALESAGLRPEARRVVSFLENTASERAARFYADGSPVPGRLAAGDGEGWIAAAQRAVIAGLAPASVLTRAAGSGSDQHGLPGHAWQDRQDYGENVTGDCSATRSRPGLPPARSRGASRPLGSCGGRGRERAGLRRPPGPPPSFPRPALDPPSGARFSPSFANPPPSASPHRGLDARARSGPRPPPGPRGRWSSWARWSQPVGFWLTCTGPRRQTGRCRSGSTRRRASRPRPHPWPGRTPSRSWPFGLATAEFRRQIARRLPPVRGSRPR